MTNAKKKTISLLAGASAVFLIGGIAGVATAPKTAFADETYFAFVDVGADIDAQVIDQTIGLTEKNAAVVEAGTVHTGSTLFTSYSENAKYSFTLSAATYRVSVAVIADESTTVTVGEEMSPVDAEGKYVFTTEATLGEDGALTVEAEGKLCGVLITAPGAEVLFAVDYTPGQVIPYGVLLSDALENATGYYADGSSHELAIEYGDITAAAGVNVNFTTVNVTGKVTGTELTVERYLITMPDDLVYFINCGSYPVEGTYKKDTIDPDYTYNWTVFDYYGEDLLNYGVPDRSIAGKDGEDWGYYTSATYTAPGDATFPYNSLLWTDTAYDMGYLLTGLTPSAGYRIYIGTLSHWHPRSVDITFNGTVVTDDTLRINSYKGFSVFEDVKADGNGKIDLHMQGASTNEPCINFIAVQKQETVVPAIPAAVDGLTVIGLEDSSMTLTGVAEGNKIQLYNAVKPNQILFEEAVDPEKITDGGYLVEWGAPFKGISQFIVVQINKGGVSGEHLVSVTDIEGFQATVPEGYTTGAVLVTVEAHAASGIVGWSYRLGEYGELHAFELGRPYAIKESFTAEENGDYIIVVTSGMGVTYSETVTVSTIDPAAPELSVLPAKEGWAAGGYNLTLNVEAIAPVSEYKMFKNGAAVTTGTAVPALITVTEAGEYSFYVKTAAGQSATKTVTVSAAPTTTKITRRYANRTFTYTFGDTESFEVASVSAFQLTSTGVSRLTVSSGNSLNVFAAGTYVVAVTSKDGTTEMFSFDLKQDEFKVTSAGGKNSSGLGIGIGVGAGGVVIAAAAILITVLKKKKS